MRRIGVILIINLIATDLYLDNIEINIKFIIDKTTKRKYKYSSNINY